MKKILYILIGPLFFFGMQSCQSMDNNPDFNYPEEKPGPTIDTYSPEKLFLSFDEKDSDDGSVYQMITSPTGDLSYVDGVKGFAYKGGEGAYVLVNSHKDIEGMMRDTIANLGQFTVAFWMDSPKNTGATGIFSIANTKEFWGNLDIFLENNDSETQAFFKVHFLNFRGGERKEGWAEIRVEDVFNSGWVHLAFAYDSKTSTLKTYRNGAEVSSNVLDGFEKLEYQNLGSIVIGTLQFQTKPSLTEGSQGEDWAKYFEGSLDELHFYNKTLSSQEIQNLYLVKKVNN